MTAKIPAPRLTAAERRATVARLVATIQWQEHFANNGDAQSAQVELDFARKLARDLQVGRWVA